jgi:hypothetical protein
MPEHMDTAGFFDLGQFLGILENGLDGATMVGPIEFRLEKNVLGFVDFPVA